MEAVRGTLWLAAVLSLMHLTLGGLIELSESDKQSIVDAHNNHRREEEAANIEYMVWDEDLAYGASLLAASCVNDHGFLTWDGSPYTAEVGQNLFASASNYGPTWPMDYWNSERLYYDYDTRTCSWMCYHYTQMVWWSNDKVGCAKALCEPLETPGSGNQAKMYYFVCNYGPGGNYVNQDPFEKGLSCGKCSERATHCQDKLCVKPETCDELDLDCECSTQCANCGKQNADCTCNCAPGYTGSECEEPCQDNSDQCGTGELSLENCGVEGFRQQMANQCALSCGFCEPANGYTCVTTTEPPETTTTIEPTGTPSMFQILCDLYGLYCDLA